MSSSSKKLLVLVFCSIALVVGQYHKKADGRVQIPSGTTFPVVIVFGDSIMDTGNNNYIKSLIKCNFPPYGQEFPGQVPTGRFCNGKVPLDLIVEELGIKEFLPAYLDPSLKPEDLSTGVCFASGGSGYDPKMPEILSVISLSQQFEFFEEYIVKLKANFGEDRTNFILANSIFMVVASSDDIATTYFDTGIRKAQYDVPAYTNLLVNFASSFVESLYELGARRIGLFSAPPIGCVPAQRTIAGGILRECAEEYNDAAMLFNSKLSASLDFLKTKLPNSRLVYVDVYTPLLDVFLYPAKYGFRVGNKGCCGTGVIEVARLCNPLTPTCENPADHVFWHSYHPTQQAYSVVLPPLVQKYINEFV